MLSLVRFAVEHVSKLSLNGKFTAYFTPSQNISLFWQLQVLVAPLVRWLGGVLVSKFAVHEYNQVRLVLERAARERCGGAHPAEGSLRDFAQQRQPGLGAHNRPPSPHTAPPRHRLTTPH